MRRPDVTGNWNELLVVFGLVLIVIGLWPTLGRGVLAIPGFVCIWLALPARLPFVWRTEPKPRKETA